MTRVPSGAAAVRALVAFLRSTLLDELVAPLEDLGGLAELLVSSGSWRPDGVARAREALAAGLDAAAAVASEPTLDGIPVADVFERVGWTWGVGRYPTPDHEVLEGLSSRGVVSASTIGKWRDAVLSSSTFVDTVLAYGPAKPAALPGVGRPVPDFDPAAWPSSSSVALIAERLERNLGSTPEDFVQLLRGAVADELLYEYLLGPAAGNLREQFADTCVRDWFYADAFEANMYRGAPSESGTAARRVIALLVEMSAAGIAAVGSVTRAPTPRDRLARASERRRTAAKVLDAQSIWEMGPQSESEHSRRRTMMPQSTGLALSDAELNASLQLTAQLVKIASDIGKAKSATETPGLADRYCTLREGLQWHRLDPTDRGQIQIADHIAHLGLLRGQHGGLMERFARIIADEPDGAAAIAYLPLTVKNDALLESKLGRLGDAAVTCIDALGSLWRTRREHDLDLRAADETEEQICLALAGISLTVAEHQLLQKRAAGQKLLEWVRLSRIAMSRVDDLLIALLSDHASGERLDSISTASWHSRALIVRLRSDLIILTASKLDMISADELESLHVDLGTTTETYRLLIADAAIAERDIPDVARITLWLGFLAQGQIPVVQHRAPVLQLCTYRAPRDTTARRDWRIATERLDILGVRDQLRGLGHDGGTPERARTGSDLHQLFARLSAGTFTQYRALDEPKRTQ
ncbi:hypothetical protein BH09ACT4_BH09ACT4_00510 [soil metagenome]